MDSESKKLLEELKEYHREIMSTKEIYNIARTKKLKHSKVYRVNAHGQEHFYIDVWGKNFPQQRLEANSLFTLKQEIENVI